MLLLFGLNVSATHLVGGNIAYTYLGDTDGDGDYNYKITFLSIFFKNYKNLKNYKFYNIYLFLISNEFVW